MTWDPDWDKFISSFKDYVGKRIASVEVINDGDLVFCFEDARPMAIYDKASLCCERRWMTCDDSLDEFKGHLLIGVELLDESTKKTEYEEEDSLFLRIITDKGSFRVCMHNEHNGYYGGFTPWLKALS